MMRRRGARHSGSNANSHRVIIWPSQVLLFCWAAKNVVSRCEKGKNERETDENVDQMIEKTVRGARGVRVDDGGGGDAIGSQVL